MIIDTEPTIETEVPSDQDLKVAILESGSNVYTKSFRFECEKTPQGLLLVKVFLGTQPDFVDPSPQLASAIKTATKHLGFIDAEIIYRDPNINNYEEPEPPKYPRKTKNVRDPSDGSTREHTY